jgi:hypothetical protein
MGNDDLADDLVRANVQTWANAPVSGSIGGDKCPLLTSSIVQFEIVRREASGLFGASAGVRFAGSLVAQRNQLHEQDGGFTKESTCKKRAEDEATAKGVTSTVVPDRAEGENERKQSGEEGGEGKENVTSSAVLDRAEGEIEEKQRGERSGGEGGGVSNEVARNEWTCGGRGDAAVQTLTNGQRDGDEQGVGETEQELGRDVEATVLSGAVGSSGASGSTDGGEPGDYKARCSALEVNLAEAQDTIQELHRKLALRSGVETVACTSCFETFQLDLSQVQ